MDFTRRKIVATPASVSFITEKVGKNFFRNVIVANSKAKNVSKEISNLANELVQECTNTSDMMPMYDSLAKLTNASLQLSSEHWISAEDVCDKHNVENNTIIAPGYRGNAIKIISTKKRRSIRNNIIDTSGKAYSVITR